MRPNKANIQGKKKKFGFNNTELINLVLIMFPAGSHWCDINDDTSVI